LVFAPNGASELFDLTEDQGETRNLAGTQSILSEELAEQWRAWKAGK
jgi:hypothetical protein